MYCKNCDRKGKKGEKFCSECGAKLTKERSAFKLSQKAKNTICILLSMFVMLTALYLIASYIFSPELAATKYFEAVINNNEGEIYSYLNVDESDFISKNLLSQKLAKFEKVDSYEIVNVEEYYNETIVEFLYTLSTGEQKTALVSLSKEEGIIFNKWKVNSAKLTKNVVIKVPNNAIVTIDNIDIKKYEIADDNEYYNTYHIPYIISGEYKVKVSLNGVLVEDDVVFESNQTYYVGKFNLDDGLQRILESDTIEKLNYLYSNAIQDKQFKELNDVDNHIETSYKLLKRNVNNSNIKITSLQVTDATFEKAEYDEEGNLQVTFICDYNMSYTSNNYPDGTNNKGSSYTILTYKYVDGSYVLYDVDYLLDLKVRW